MAHQGEELVIALPAVMLGAAFLILRWAAGQPAEPEEAPDSTAAASAPGLDPRDLALVGAGKVAVEPPDEEQPARDPGDDQG